MGAGGGLDPEQLSRGQSVPLETSRVLEAEGERDGREEEELAEQRSQERRGSLSSWEKGQGREAELGGGRSASLPGWFSLMLTACYLLSI